MKYSYVALSAAVLASTATAAPLFTVSTPHETLNENGGIKDRRDIIGVGNADSNSDLDLAGSHVTISARSNDIHGVGNANSGASNVDLKDADISFAKRLVSFGVDVPNETMNQNGGIKDRRDIISGAGNDNSGASNVDFHGAHITGLPQKRLVTVSDPTETMNKNYGIVDRRSNTISGVGNANQDSANVDMNGAHISFAPAKRLVTVSTPHEVANKNYGIVDRRDDVSGAGNDNSDSSNVDFNGAHISFGPAKRLFTFSGGSQTMNENGGIKDRRDTISGAGNDNSGASNVDFHGAHITGLAQRDTISGAGNDNSGSSNVDFHGAHITGLPQKRSNTISGVGNANSDSSNVDLNDATISFDRRLVTVSVPNETENQNYGIKDRRSNTISGVGNANSGSSNVDLKDAYISFDRRSADADLLA